MDVRHCDASDFRDHHHDSHPFEYDNDVGGAREHEHQFRISARIYQLYFHRDFHGRVRAENVCPAPPLLSQPVELLRFRRGDPVYHRLDPLRIYQTVLCPTYAFPYHPSSAYWTYFATHPRGQGYQNAPICFDDVPTGPAQYRIAALSRHFYLFHFRDESVCLRKKRRRSR